jgi:excisionase family DNA binding protein
MADQTSRLDERLALVAEGLFTITETGAFLKVSRATVYNLMDRGELPFVKVGRTRRIPKRAVLQLAAQALEGGVPINGGAPYRA